MTQIHKNTLFFTRQTFMYLPPVFSLVTYKNSHKKFLYQYRNFLNHFLRFNSNRLNKKNNRLFYKPEHP